MKRILCIVGSMNAGGAETFLMKLYRNLDKTKYQMDFAVAIEKESFYDKEIYSYGGKIYHIIPKSLGLFKNYNNIKKIVKENEYKYVLRTSQHSLSALELLAAKRGGAKVRIFRSSNSNTVSGSRKQLITHRIFMFMPRYFANVRIAPSSEAAEFMFGKKCIEKGKALLLHNAIDTSVFNYDETIRKEMRNELGLNDKYLVGHIGRFNQQKNHKYLIKIFKELLNQIPDSVLVLVGEGELEFELKNQIKDLGIEEKVLFLGIRKDINRLLNAFDVFVFPSLYEGMPNTVIEAQATGLPCIISNTISKEANITGLVTYLPLSENVDLWIKKIIQSKENNRTKTEELIKKNAYDIQLVTEKFINMITERGN